MCTYDRQLLNQDIKRCRLWWKKTFPNWWPLPPSVVPPLPCPSHLSRGLDPLCSILRNLLHQTPTSFILSYPQCWPHSLRFSLFFAESNIADKMYNSTLSLTMNKRNHWNVVKGTLKTTLLVGVQYLNYHAQACCNTSSAHVIWKLRNIMKRLTFLTVELWH